MPEVTNNNVYDMGGMSYRENISKRIAEFTRENLFIGIPARVISTDDYSTLQCLDVQPVINDVYTTHEGIILEANVIRKVFVLLERAGGFSIELPVAKGDIVTLFYAHKDLGEWLDSSGTEQISQSVLKIANIEDCWCELRGGTRKDNLKPSTSNFVIKGNSTTITITPDGDYSIETPIITENITQKTTTAESTTLTSPENTVEGNLTVVETLTATTSVLGNATFTTIETSGETGVSGTFTSADNKTIVVTNGIITSIT